MFEPEICIYHADCQDGFTAAWVVATKYPNVQLIAAHYGDKAPDVAGKHVVIVDFSYPLEVMQRMASKAKRLAVLDHHKSAEQAVLSLLNQNLAEGIFDMTRSGATLAWEWAWGPGRSIPALVQHVEDRDLWRFDLDGTREISAVLGSYDMTVDTWTWLAKRVEHGSPARAPTIEEGAAILRGQRRQLREMLRYARHTVTIDGHTVPAANLPREFASEGGHALALGAPFAAAYTVMADGMIHWSLRRSEESEIDLSEIAEKLGGGGHAAAAGFKTPANFFTLDKKGA